VATVVGNIMQEDLHGISEHEEWFEGGRPNVYTERLFGVGWFQFLLFLLILLYSIAIDNFEKASMHSLFLLMCSSSPCPNPKLTGLILISAMSDPACYTTTSLSQHTSNWMCLCPSTRCKYCSEPCSVSCWVYPASNHCWADDCDDCVDIQI